jgi:HD-GYP domain-containing protein (c-di-GMP phosphodiesterase class II)
MSPFEARDTILNGADSEFDPKVIAAFNALFKRGALEIWSAPLSAV